MRFNINFKNQRGHVYYIICIYKNYENIYQWWSISTSHGYIDDHYVNLIFGLPPKPAVSCVFKCWVFDKPSGSIKLFNHADVFAEGSIECLKLDKTMYHIVLPQYIESIPLHYSIASILCTRHFHHGRAETTTRLSLLWDAQPLALHFTISIWWRLGNRSVQFRNQGGSSSVVAGWWFQKTCLLESARKLGVPKPPEIYGYFFGGL